MSNIKEQRGRSCGLIGASCHLPHEDPLAGAKGIAIGVSIMVPLWIALFWWIS